MADRDHILASDFDKFLHDALDGVAQHSTIEEFNQQFEVIRHLVYGLREDIQGIVLTPVSNDIAAKAILNVVDNGVEQNGAVVSDHAPVLYTLSFPISTAFVVHNCSENLSSTKGHVTVQCSVGAQSLVSVAVTNMEQPTKTIPGSSHIIFGTDELKYSLGSAIQSNSMQFSKKSDSSFSREEVATSATQCELEIELNISSLSMDSCFRGSSERPPPPSLLLAWPHELILSFDDGYCGQGQLVLISSPGAAIFKVELVGDSLIAPMAASTISYIPTCLRENVIEYKMSKKAEALFLAAHNAAAGSGHSESAVSVAESMDLALFHRCMPMLVLRYLIYETGDTSTKSIICCLLGSSGWQPLAMGLPLFISWQQYGGKSVLDNHLQFLELTKGCLPAVTMDMMISLLFTFPSFFITS